jgi:hypothetical protein
VAELLIDFEWQRDLEGYRLADAEPERPSQPFIHPLHPEWGPQPPGLLRSGGAAQPQRVVGLSGRLGKIRPLNGQRGDRLFATFTNSASSPAGVLNFINQYGPLTTMAVLTGAEPVPGVIEHAQAMRRFIKAANGRGRMAEIVGVEGIPLSGMNAAVIWDKNTKVPRLRFSPRNLLDALWMQLAYGLSSGVCARECRQCGEIFTAGPSTSRRGDAEFCSPEHQILFNSLKRRRGDNHA